MSSAKNLCVFCGSSLGARSEYRAAALALAAEIVERGYGLVYGGANRGLMGALADAVLERGGFVTGVLPKLLETHEVAHRGIQQLEIVASMHARKQRMADLADGFVALPGGFGTLEELMEILTWSQLGMHRKPIGVLDVEGYYRPLITFLDHATTERLLAPEHRAMLMVDSDPGRLLARFAQYQPRAVPKWLDRDGT